jgi:hypothetical protein
VAEVPNLTTAKKPGPLQIIQYSLIDDLTFNLYLFRVWVNRGGGGMGGRRTYVERANVKCTFASHLVQ